MHLNPTLLTIFVLGFSSGLPLALSSSTLQAWYTTAGIDISHIGLLSLVGLPYVFKFLWAPWLDRYIPIAVLGRRRSWIFVSQVLMIVILVLMAFLSPKELPIEIALLALILAFFSASQDIAFDAYRSDVSAPQLRGLAAAYSVTGYRIAMLVSSGLALIIADYWGWQWSFIVMALVLSTGLIASLKGPEPEYTHSGPKDIKEAVIRPFQQFWQRPGLEGLAARLLIFIVLYKLGDAFAGNLSTAFLLRELGFSLSDVGLLTKTIGLVSTLLGVFLGGLFLYRYGLYLSLLYFAILQAISNFGFVLLSLTEKSYWSMAIVMSIENLAGGMGTAAFVAFLMSLCDKRYSATQFALFSALAAFGRVYVGPMAGYGVEWMGWTGFFIATIIIAIPGVVLLVMLKNTIQTLDDNQTNKETSTAV